MRIHPRHEIREEARRRLSSFIVEKLMPILSPTEIILVLSDEIRSWAHTVVKYYGGRKQRGPVQNPEGEEDGNAGANQAGVS